MARMVRERGEGLGEARIEAVAANALPARCTVFEDVLHSVLWLQRDSGLQHMYTLVCKRLYVLSMLGFEWTATMQRVTSVLYTKGYFLA